MGYMYTVVGVGAVVWDEGERGERGEIVRDGWKGDQRITSFSLPLVVMQVC